jgi:hypothetical protein
MMQAKTLTSTATLLATVLLAGLIVFQLALAVGVPWGAASYGGAAPSVPPHLRAVSVGAAGFWGIALLVVLRRGGHAVWTPLPVTWLSTTVWVLVGLLVLACVLNSLTPSAIERAIWLPVSLVLLASVVTLQVTADH